MATLVHFHSSPWSEKARWALDHHGIPCRRVEHVPMLGEPLIRLWMRRPFEKVTVPLLLAEEHRLADSGAIARWADERGGGTRLFPREHQAAIAHYEALSERILSASRARVTRRIRDSDAALMEQVPRPLKRLGKAATVMASQGAGYVLQKYGADEHSDGSALTLMRRGFEELREALGEVRPETDRYLLGELTYADIAMAVTLQGVRPVDDTHLRLGPATRAAWTDPDLEGEMDDLLAWRDRMYESHRARNRH